MLKPFVHQPQQTQSHSDAEILAEARRVLGEEADAVRRLGDNLDETFCQVARLIAGSAGKVITTGIGKSGIIAQKVASTLTSTGTVALFLNSADAMHGDLGVLGPDDVILAFSNSGETPEVTEMIPAVARINANLVAITAKPKSTLARAARYTLLTYTTREACPLNLAPTTSTTVSLALGDALASCLMKLRGFTPEHFAVYHPGGSLGRKLLLKVDELMQAVAPETLVQPSWTMRHVVQAMCDPKAAGIGMACVIDAAGCLLGVITDGDVRRGVLKHGGAFLEMLAADVMSRRPVTVSAGVRAAAVLDLLTSQQRKISVVAVTDPVGHPVGLVRLQDLMNAFGTAEGDEPDEM